MDELQDIPEYDVIIVGYGPVGATLGGLLAMRGVRTLVLEREDEVYRLPRAATCDDESLRTWQAFGVSDTLMEAFIPEDTAVFYNARGEKFFELHRRHGFGHGWPVLSLMYQPHLERVLRKHLTATPNLELRLGHAVESFDDAEGAVTVLARERSSGTAFRARAQYMIGCDGGRSSIREQLGVEFTGKTYQRWLVLDGKVRDPSKLPKELLYICDPARPICTFPQAFSYHRWQFMLREEETREQMETDEVAEELLARWSSLTEIELIRQAVYIYHARIAEQWKVGRVILAGDSAHLMPPFGGQGMNSGIRDASNLAWKLALVIRRLADPSILETYEVERKPHVTNMVKLSLGFATVLTTQNRTIAFAREILFRILYATPGVGAWLRRGEFKPSAMFPRGFMVGGRRRARDVADGTMIIQPHVNRNGVRVRFDDAIGTDWGVVAIDADPRAVVDDETRTMWDRLPTRFVRVVPLGGSVASINGDDTTIVEDADGELAEWFKRHRITLAVLRPDKVVFGACDTAVPGSALELARNLRATLNAPADRRSSGHRRLSISTRRATTPIEG